MYFQICLRERRGSGGTFLCRLSRNFCQVSCYQHQCSPIWHMACSHNAHVLCIT